MVGTMRIEDLPARIYTRAQSPRHDTPFLTHKVARQVAEASSQYLRIRLSWAWFLRAIYSAHDPGSIAKDPGPLGMQKACETLVDGGANASRRSFDHIPTLYSQVRRLLGKPEKLTSY